MRKCSVSPLIFLALFAGCSREESGETEGRPLDRPPEPNFEQPVDYRAWYAARNFQEDWPNGEDVYAEIIKAVEEETFPEPDDTEREKLNRACKGPWSAEEMPELNNYIESLEPYLALLGRAAEVEDVQWFANTTIAELWSKKWGIPNAGRTLVKATLARASRERASKPPSSDGLLEAWRISFVHARHQQHATQVGFRASIGIRTFVHASVAGALSEGVLEGEELKRALTCVVEQDQPVNLAEAYRFEWLGLLAFVQELYPGGRFSDAAAKRLGQAEYLPPGGVFLPRPQETTARLDEYFTPFVRLAQDPFSPARLKEAETLAERREKIAGRNLILSLYIPPLSAQYQLAIQIEARRRGTITMLALHVFHEEQRRWPEKLADCGPIVEAARVDPFSGEDFVYALRDGQPWLYSVALDGEDNGGKHDARWGRLTPGTDFIFWPVPGSEDPR